MTLTAGELTRARAGEVRDPEPLEERAAVASAEGDVPLDVQVREERVVLEHEADGPLLRRPVDAPRRVEPRLAGDADPAAVRSRQPGDAAQHRGLPRSRRPHERDGLAPDLELER